MKSQEHEDLCNRLGEYDIEMSPSAGSMSPYVGRVADEILALRQQIAELRSVVDSMQLQPAQELVSTPGCLTVDDVERLVRVATRKSD